MRSVSTGEIPENGALMSYALRPGCYTDCYFVDVPGQVVLSDFISTFFNTPLFRVERFILAVVASQPTTIEDVKNISEGKSDRFAVWKVESRDDFQLMMSVGDGPIRSWWMVSPGLNNNEYSRIYFGSAVLSTTVDSAGAPKIGAFFRIFLGFHKAYAYSLHWLAKRNFN